MWPTRAPTAHLKHILDLSPQIILPAEDPRAHVAQNFNFMDYGLSPMVFWGILVVLFGFVFNERFGHFMIGDRAVGRWIASWCPISYDPNSKFLLVFKDIFFQISTQP